MAAVARVAVEVRALTSPSIAAPAVDVPAGDRAALRATGLVLVDRWHVVVGLVAVELVRALHQVPAEVGAGQLVERDPVDLLPRVLADVGEPEVPGLAVEREPPRVAQPVGDDLPRGVVDVEEGVVGRDPVGLGGQRVDPQQRPERRGQVLAGLERVAAAAPVAEAEVEPAVRPDLDVAPVVVRVGLVEGEHRPAVVGSGTPSTTANASITVPPSRSVNDTYSSLPSAANASPSSPARRRWWSRR
jgi:hypothetical protein